MDGETRSGIFGSRHRQGFFLMEALLLALIIALAAASAVPVYSEWEDEKRLDLAAAEACALIRSAQQEAKTGRPLFPEGESRRSLSVSRRPAEESSILRFAVCTASSRRDICRKES